jgi:hypothetical protein
MDASQEMITNYILQVSDIIKNLNPVLIYLYQRDMLKALQTMRAVRGDEFETFQIAHIGATTYGQRTHVNDFSGLVSAFQYFKGIIDHVFLELSLKKISIDTLDGDWEKYLDRITEFLLVEAMEEIRPPFEDLSDFAGTYQEPESKTEFAITTDGENMYLGDTPGFRLIYKTGMTFYLEGLEAEIAFFKDESGSIERFVGRSPLPELNNTWVKRKT